MKLPLQIIIKGEPIPKQSARMGRYGVYQPTSLNNAKKDIIWQVKSQLPKDFEVFKGGLKVSVDYIFSPLKSASKKDKEFIANGGLVFKTTKPDVHDNLNKLPFDAMEEMIFKNDSRICDFKARKFYGKEPMTIVRFEKAPRYITKK